MKSLESQIPTLTSAAVSLASEAQSMVSSELPSLTAVAASLASEARSAVSIATAAAVTPRNCSLGTRFFCVGYTGSVNCSKLPLNISGVVANAIHNTHLENDLAALDEKLRYVTPGLIEGPLVLVIVSAGILLALLVPVVRCLFWKRESIHLL